MAGANYSKTVHWRSACQINNPTPATTTAPTKKEIRRSHDLHPLSISNHRCNKLCVSRTLSTMSSPTPFLNG
jgi:hypothetical protein